MNLDRWLKGRKGNVTKVSVNGVDVSRYVQDATVAPSSNILSSTAATFTGAGTTVSGGPAGWGDVRWDTYSMRTRSDHVHSGGTLLGSWTTRTPGSPVYVQAPRYPSPAHHDVFLRFSEALYRSPISGALDVVHVANWLWDEDIQAHASGFCLGQVLA